MTGTNLKNHLAIEIAGFLQSDQKNAELLQLNDSILTEGNVTKINNRKDMSKIICNSLSGSKTHTLKTVKQQLLTKKGGHIAIVGQAQIGKTHLVKQLFCDERLKERFDYVFYVSLKYADCSKELNILQFLTNESNSFRWFDYDSDSRADYQLFKRIVEQIHNDSNKVCIILDDFEHISFSFNDFAETKSLFEKNKTGYLLSNVLKTWFKQSHKVLVLPPWQYFQLQQIDELNSMFVTYVQGLNSDGQKNLIGTYIKTSCKNTKCPLKPTCLGFVSACQSVKNCCVCNQCHKFNCHYEIQLFCSNPGNCLQLKKYSQALNSTSTIVAVAAISIVWLDKVLRSHSPNSENCSFKRISAFAWKSYAQKMFFFYESDLCNSGLSQKELNTFFSVMLNSPFGTSAIRLTDVVFYFSHLFIQEILAALWLLSLSPNDFNYQLYFNRDSFKNGNLDILCKFMEEICENPLLKSFQKSLFWKIELKNWTKLKSYKKDSNTSISWLRDVLVASAFALATIGALTACSSYRN